MMKPMKGQATIAFDDGSVYEAEVDISFTSRSGAMSGSGTIIADNIMAMAHRPGTPILKCGGRRFRVVIDAATSDGQGHIMTTGAPL